MININTFCHINTFSEHRDTILFSLREYFLINSPPPHTHTHIRQLNRTNEMGLMQAGSLRKCAVFSKKQNRKCAKQQSGAREAAAKKESRKMNLVFEFDASKFPEALRNASTQRPHLVSLHTIYVHTHTHTHTHTSLSTHWACTWKSLHSPFRAR